MPRLASAHPWMRLFSRQISTANKAMTFDDDEANEWTYLDKINLIAQFFGFLLSIDRFFRQCQ